MYCLQMWITRFFRCVSVFLLTKQVFYFLQIALRSYFFLWGFDLLYRMLRNDLESLHEHTVLFR